MTTVAAATLLELNDLNVHIGDSHILQGVSFSVREGGITGLLGRNGVGKTTTLRGSSVWFRAAAASRSLGVTDQTSGARGRALRRRVRPEDRDVFAGLTVAQNLRLAERSSPPRYDLVYELFPELKQRAQQRRRHAPAASSRWCARPRPAGRRKSHALIDEPTKVSRRWRADGDRRARRAPRSGDDPVGEQNLSVAHALARDVIVLDRCRVGFVGDVDQLMGDPALARRHLGIASAGGHG